jgi:uncharacterized protein YybS (DUF2232 family)
VPPCLVHLYATVATALSFYFFLCCRKKFINAVTKAVVVVTKVITDVIERSIEDLDKLRTLLEESFSEVSYY